MVYRSLLLVLLAGFALADTGYKDTIRVKESDGSPSCMAGEMIFNAGQLTCSGNKATLNITGGGGGTSSLAVTVGVARSSPTSDVMFNANQFSGSVSGSSITVTLQSSSVTLQGQNVIKLGETLQSGATFYVSSGSATNFYAGTLYANGGAVPAGSDTQVQYNSSGRLGASSNLTFNGSNLLTLAGSGLFYGNPARFWSTVTDNSGTNLTAQINTVTPGAAQYFIYGTWNDVEKFSVKPQGMVTIASTTYIASGTTITYQGHVFAKDIEISTVTASSGTVGTFNIGTSIRWPDGTIQVSSPSASGSSSLTNTQVAFGSASDTITSTSSFVWNNTPGLYGPSLNTVGAHNLYYYPSSAFGNTTSTITIRPSNSDYADSILSVETGQNNAFRIQVGTASAVGLYSTLLIDDPTNESTTCGYGAVGFLNYDYASTGDSVCFGSGGVKATQNISATYGVAAATGVFSNDVTVGGQSVCREDGTNCPAGGAGDMILASTQTVTGRKVFQSSTTFSGGIYISSTVLLSNAPGVSGQLLASGGPGAIPTWVTASGTGDMVLTSTQTVSAKKVFTSTRSIEVSPSGDLGTTIGATAAATSGAVMLDASATTGYTMTIFNSGGQTVGSATSLLNIISTNTTYGGYFLRILRNDSNSNGDIRIDSPAPNIEFVETDQVSPAGKFEIGVNSGISYWATRNTADDAFERTVEFGPVGSGPYVAIQSTGALRFEDQESSYIGFAAPDLSASWTHRLWSTPNNLGLVLKQTANSGDRNLAWDNTFGASGSSLTVAGAFVTNSYLSVAGSATITGAQGVNVTYGVSAATASFTTDVLVNSQSVCLEDGTNCPAGGAGDMILSSTQTVTGRKVFESSTTFSGGVYISSTVLLSGAPGTSGLPMLSGGNGAVPSWAQIGDAAIADGAVDGGTGGEIADGSITSADLGTDSVSADELNATGVEGELEAVLDVDQLQGQITDTQIADGAVDGGTGGEVADDTLTAADLAADSVGQSELTEAMNFVPTGTWDFGGATGLEIPNGTNPTVDATGEMAFDTTDGTIVAYDGSVANVVAFSTHCFSVNVSSGLGYNSLSEPIWTAPVDMAVTLTQIKATSLGSGTTVLFQLDEAASAFDSAGTDVFSVAYASANYTTETYPGAGATLSNAGIAAGSTLVLNCPASGASTSTPRSLYLYICYKRDRE